MRRSESPLDADLVLIRREPLGRGGAPKAVQLPRSWSRSPRFRRGGEGRQRGAAIDAMRPAVRMYSSPDSLPFVDQPVDEIHGAEFAINAPLNVISFSRS